MQQQRLYARSSRGWVLLMASAVVLGLILFSGLDGTSVSSSAASVTSSACKVNVTELQETIQRMSQEIIHLHEVLHSVVDQCSKSNDKHVMDSNDFVELLEDMKFARERYNALKDDQESSTTNVDEAERKRREDQHHERSEKILESLSVLHDKLRDQQMELVAKQDEILESLVSVNRTMQLKKTMEVSEPIEPVISSPTSSSTTATIIRNVTVPTMCRCPSGHVPSPFGYSPDVVTTDVVQEPSIAVGPAQKRFWMRKSRCKCIKSNTTQASDPYLKKMKQHARCKSLSAEAKFSWNRMPDLGIEERVPLYLGVLSYKSPKSLEKSLQNWKELLFPHIHVDGMFVQLNNRSVTDDEVIEGHRDTIPVNISVFGTAEENIHPGRAIARFCRAAEERTRHSDSLLMFLEKDWHVGQDYHKEFVRAMESVHVLSQRGVPYMRLSRPVAAAQTSWSCHAKQVDWTCTHARNHRYTNLPSVIRCDWFLRYLEPFALVDDASYLGCSAHWRERNYIDWQELMQDGRVAWTNAQWIVASSKHNFFERKEVDGERRMLV